MICGVLRCGPGFSWALFGWLGLPVLITALAGEPLEPDRVATMIEALTRLGPEKVKANPKLKEALEKVLEATKGTPQFVELVRDFNIKDRDAELLEIAVKNPNNSTGVEATRLILANRNFQLLTSSLAGTNAIKAAEALGNTGENGIVPLLEPMVADMKRDVALRKQAVRALVQAQEGAAALLKLAKEQKLPDDVTLLASSELNNVRWANLKAEAAQLLPLPQARNAQSLPPISDLVKMKGDPAKGAERLRDAQAIAGPVRVLKLNQRIKRHGP